MTSSSQEQPDDGSVGAAASAGSVSDCREPKPRPAFWLRTDIFDIMSGAIVGLILSVIILS